jgi:hypothetical protein
MMCEGILAQDAPFYDFRFNDMLPPIACFRRSIGSSTGRAFAKSRYRCEKGSSAR